MGATGAVVGEFTADQFRAELIDAAQSGGLTEEQVVEWDARGVGIARLAGGMAVALAGGDGAAVWVGADAAGNAAEHNASGFPS